MSRTKPRGGDKRTREFCRNIDAKTRTLSLISYSEWKWAFLPLIRVTSIQQSVVRSVFTRVTHACIYKHARAVRRSWRDLSLNSSLRERWTINPSIHPGLRTTSSYLSTLHYRYSFSMDFSDLATMTRISLVRSLQFGIALETAHQFSPWWGSASTHRCITLSCWAWTRKRD